MKKIKKLVDSIEHELNGAKDYAESYLLKKSEGDMTWANRYKEMANDELKHASYIHDKAVAEITELQRIYTAPADMEEKWEKSHKEFIEKTAWIRQMLAM